MTVSIQEPLRGVGLHMLFAHSFTLTTTTTIVTIAGSGLTNTTKYSACFHHNIPFLTFSA